MGPSDLDTFVNRRTLRDRTGAPRIENPVPRRLSKPPVPAHHMHGRAGVSRGQRSQAIHVPPRTNLQATLNCPVDDPAHGNLAELRVVDESPADVGMDAREPHFPKLFEVLAPGVGVYEVLGVAPGTTRTCDLGICNSYNVIDRDAAE